MSTKFHLTVEGPKICKAHVQACKLLHFENQELAQEKYEEILNTAIDTMGSFKKSETIPAQAHPLNEVSKADTKLIEEVSKEIQHRLTKARLKLSHLDTEIIAKNEEEDKYRLALDRSKNLDELSDADFTDAHLHKEIERYSIARKLRKFDDLYPGLLNGDLQLIEETRGKLEEEKEETLKTISTIESKII